MGRGGTAIAGVRRLYEAGTLVGLSDGELLARFVDRGDGPAFEALVARHGGLVMGVCRALLRDPDDAADAFQATFLVLVRKAGTVRVSDTLGPWLHGVARKVAARAGARAARRRARETTGHDPAPDVAHAPESGDPEAVPAPLDELGRLPDRLRAPIVLCHLEGLTHDQAAVRLGVPVGTIRSRLSRGRALLRDRLARRGVGGPAAAAPWAWFRPGVVPTSLASATHRNALAYLTSRPAAGAVPASILALTEGALMATATNMLKASTALALALCAAGAVHAYQAARPKGAEAGQASPNAPAQTQPGIAPTFFRTYDVGDLVIGSPRGFSDPGPLDLRPVIELVTTAIAPGSWSVVYPDGPDPDARQGDNAVGTISPLYPRRSLRIRHTAEVHDLVAALIRGVERLPAVREPGPIAVEVARPQGRSKGGGDPIAPEEGATEPDAGTGIALTVEGPRTRFTDLIATYQIDVTNDGSARSEGIQIGTTLPADCRLVGIPNGARFDAGTRRLTWEGVSPRPGEFSRRTFELRAERPGIVALAVEARADGGPPQKKAVATKFVSRDAPAELSVRVTLERQQVEVGGLVVWHINILNKGKTDATGLKVVAEHSDAISPHETSGTEARAYRNSHSAVVFPMIERLGPGRATELTIKARAIKPTHARLGVQVRHDGMGGSQVAQHVGIGLKVSGPEG